jgi:D-alanyl-lipoteichoic acid acyltransferase DltB (MBOAT superfamily)
LNYSEFSFWWVLILFSVPFFTVRYIAKSLNLWRGIFDTVGLLAMSLMLFFNANVSSFIIFGVEVIFNYLMVQLMLRTEGWKAKLIAGITITINIAVLAYFKYLTFFVTKVAGLVVDVPPDWEQGFPIPVFHTIPPGVSFYTFEMVAFVIDSLNARKKKAVGWLEYANFMAFFPKIVAGPIERRLNLLPQLESFHFKFTVDNFEEGLRWVSLGLFMKFALAENIVPYIDLRETANAWFIWFEAFLFNLRIYFDFAGYSFIALGLAKILGVRLTVNFLAPYTSQSINEFWQRWHVTLSTWFRDYVFIPLMGTKKQWAAFFLFLTFTLSGFWHGAAWNFVIWGAYHGGLLLLLRYLGRPFHGFLGRYISQPQIISWALTFGAVIFGCLFFMETNVHRLVEKLHSLVTPSAYSLANLSSFLGSYDQNKAVVLIIILLLSVAVLLMEHIAVWQRKFEYELLLNRWLSPILLFLALLLAPKAPSPFIYFNF